MTAGRAFAALVLASVLTGCAHPPAREARANGKGEEVILSGYLGKDYGRYLLFTLPAEARKPDSNGFEEYYEGCIDLAGNAAMHDRFAELDGEWVTVRAKKVIFAEVQSGAYEDDVHGIVFWQLRRKFRGVRVDNPRCGNRTQSHWVVDIQPSEAPAG